MYSLEINFGNNIKHKRKDIALMLLLYSYALEYLSLEYINIKTSMFATTIFPYMLMKFL